MRKRRPESNTQPRIDDSRRGPAGERGPFFGADNLIWRRFWNTRECDFDQTIVPRLV